MITDKSKLFGSFKKKTKVLQVPGTDETLEFVELSVKDKSDFVTFQKKHEGEPVYASAFVIARSCVILDDDDIPEILNKLDIETINKFSLEILELSGWIPKAIEEAEKN